MQPSRVIVKTERLTVRLLCEADVPAVALLWADEQVTRFMGGPRLFEEVRASLMRGLVAKPPTLDLWPVVENSSGRVVGHCGLLPKTVDGRNEVELVYVIATPFWGRGYATEAAAAIREYGIRILGIVRLLSLIDPEHAASERVALKLGMRREGDTVRPSGKTMRVYAIDAEPSDPPNDAPATSVENSDVSRGGRHR
jgi:[ribosomal protein S5]-alanine N-acetyltransferase